jgi:hypothetical protein
MRSLTSHLTRLGLFVFGALAVLAGSTSARAQPVYIDVSSSSGFQPPFLANIPAGGIAVADFDRDGDPDIFVTGYFMSNRLYWNQGDGSFQSRPDVDATLTGTACSVAVAGDIDNDGWPDLYYGCRDSSNRLLRNLHGEGFVDITVAAVDHAPISANSARTDAVALADIDGNGLLDLYIGVYPSTSSPNLDDPDNLDRIVLNDGASQWRVVSPNGSPVLREKLARTALAAVFSDLDRDGRPDLYVVNDKQQGNTLWRNQGPGCGGWCFDDGAAAAGAAQTPFGMGIAVADVDRDGDWDLYFSSIDEQFFLLGNGIAPLAFNPQPASPLNHLGVGWGTIFLDVDNDGLEDAFLAIGAGGFSTTPNADQLFRNLGGGAFLAVGSDSGLGSTLPTQAAARLDYDSDGRLDLVLGHWNEGYRLYRNVGNAGHWLGIELEGGGRINRDGIGAVVEVDLDGGVRQIRELRAGESRGSSHDRRLHFGLGNSTAASVRVRWPDGSVQELGTLAAGRYHRVYHPQEWIHRADFE